MVVLIRRRGSEGGVGGAVCEVCVEVDVEARQSVEGVLSELAAEWRVVPLSLSSSLTSKSSIAP